jgi:hypothetical protein
MPQLSSFMSLGVMIFAATFILCYVFAGPKKMLGRAMGLAMFLSIAAITNEQSYSFLSVATTALMFPLIFLLFTITAHIPFSPLPEKSILRLLGRFFHSSEYLMSAMYQDASHATTRLERWARAYHAREVATLPAKLSVWLPHLDTRVLPGTSPEQVQLLLTSLQSLTYRMQELLEEEDVPQSKLLSDQLSEDFRTWHSGIQASLQRLANDQAVADEDELRVRLDVMLNNLETRIKTALDEAPEEQTDDQHAENFYRLLGAYRGVSEALLDCVGNAGAIDWAPWHEERFA